MALCPFAVQKLIPVNSSDPRIKVRVGILHVDAGNAFSLFNLFKKNQQKGGSGIESHFHIRTDGVIEQYRDTNREADANYKANPFAISIETQGYGSGKWNSKQLESIKQLILWLYNVEGIPLAKTPTWDGAGWGYHVMFGAPGKWTPVAKSCPGPKRIKQFNEIIVPWLNKVREEANAKKRRPALGKYKTKRRTNKRAQPLVKSKILSYLRPGATVNIREVAYDKTKNIWFGAYKTKLGNKRWIPMRSTDVAKV